MSIAPVTLVGIVGSLRAESLHRVLCRAAVGLVPEGVTLVEVSVDDVPLYDADVEAAGDPAAVVELKAAVGGADGVVFFTPEYNRSVPAVTKNALDWASRVPGASAIGGKPIGIVAGTPGGHDASGVRAALALTAAGARARPFDETLGIAHLRDQVDGGELVDQATRAALAGYLDRFVEFVRAPAEGG